MYNKNKNIQVKQRTVFFFAIIITFFTVYNTSSAQSGYTWKSVIAGG